MDSSILHLRPFYATGATCKASDGIKAVTDDLLLICSGSVYSILRLTEPCEGPNFSTKLPANLIPHGGCVYSFLNNSTICFTHTLCSYTVGNDTMSLVTVLRSANEQFQGSIESKTYSYGVNALQAVLAGVHLAAYYPEVVDGQLVITTQHDGPATDSVTIVSLHADIPEWSSTNTELVFHECGRRTISNCGYISNFSTNGRFFSANSHGTGGDMTLVGDMQTDDVHRLHGQKYGNNMLGVRGDCVIFRWLEVNKLSFTVVRICGQELSEVCYKADFPLILRGSEYLDSFNISGKRFFFISHSVVFTGYLPGADVSLEEIATAAVWREIRPGVQFEMLRNHHVSYQHILLRAIREEKTSKEKS